MPGRMEFQFDLPTSAPSPARRDADAPLRLLIMADLSGRGLREASAEPLDLASRPLPSIDVDHFDAVLARFEPALSLPLGMDGALLPIQFGQIDDFHPDALYQRLALFQALRQHRARLCDPASFTEAVAELHPASPQDAAQSAPTSVMEADSDLIERLLGRAPSAPPPRHPDESAAAALQTLLQTVVQPHIVRSDPRQPAWVAALDAAISDLMRAVLHQPAFQAMEATWRGIHGLVNTLDSASVQVFLLDVAKSELLRDLYDADGRPSATQLYRRLIDQGVRVHGGEPWTVLIGDYAFGAGAEDLALLAALGALAARAGGPFLAAADPGLLGCESAGQLADPAQWLPLPVAMEQHWRALRASPIAPWLGLAAPRVLLRLPYGRHADPVETFAFEEMSAAGRDPDALLWGNPAFGCARLLTAAFAENGWEFNPGDVLDIDDLPMYIFATGDERLMQPVTETLLGERAMDALLARGIMPLLGHRNRNAARLARFQSLAEPATELAGVWRYEVRP
jgi:type VI secretion system protein ImpC